MTHNELLTVQEVADLLRHHENTIYRWVREGTLTPISLGRKLLFRRSDIEQLLEQTA